MTESETDLFGGPEAEARLKKRYAAERRFRLYGLSAIITALVFLVLLLVSIGAQAGPAFTRHTISFDLSLPADIVAPTGLDDTAAIARNVSGFYQLIREDLVRTFPETKDNRPARLELSELVTRLAALPMAREVAANPAMIGRTGQFEIALSDDLSLYLKGLVTDEKRLTLSGPVQVLTADATPALPFVRLIRPGGFPGLLNAVDKAGDTSTILLQSGPALGRVEGFSADGLDMRILAGNWQAFADTTPVAHILAVPESERNVTDRQIAWVLSLKEQGRIKAGFNTALFTSADSTYPELAGTLAAIVGSLFTMLVTAMLALPIGVMAALYLEEFSPQNRLTMLIEVNINNLAAVPSIIFGLLGAAIFLNVMDLQRSAPIVGGLVLGLMTLPVVIIASRASLKAVPPSIRDAALGIGASKTQSVFHHVLPLAAPGIFTGAIIGMARALGETAPLLLIGMVAFVAEIPSGPGDESTVLPVLIYKWSTGAERAWEPLTAAAIIILLVFMVVMNAAAVFLRRKFERRW